MKAKSKRPISQEEEEEYDEEEVDESQEEMEEELEEAEAPVVKPKQSNLNKQTPTSHTPRYFAYVQHQAEGVIDRKTNTPVASSLWEMLALIYEELTIIKNKLGDMTN